MLVSAASSVARFNVLVQSWDLKAWVETWEAGRREGSEGKRLIDLEVERMELSETWACFRISTGNPGYKRRREEDDLWIYWVCPDDEVEVNR